MEKIITDNQCSYGCGQKANYINKSGNLMCLDNSSKCPVNKEKNSSRLKESYASGKRKPSKIVYESLPEETKKRMNWNKDNYKADFSLNGKGSHKKVLIKERGHQCESCKLKEWLLEPIPLELEHCDGNNQNNEKSNLLLLCPNCHAKTKFYRGRNKNSGKKKISDELLLTSVKNNDSIRQALIDVGLTPKGGNYDRVKKLITSAGVG